MLQAVEWKGGYELLINSDVEQANALFLSLGTRAGKITLVSPKRVVI